MIRSLLWRYVASAGTRRPRRGLAPPGSVRTALLGRWRRLPPPDRSERARTGDRGRAPPRQSTTRTWIPQTRSGLEAPRCDGRVAWPCYASGARRDGRGVSPCPTSLATYRARSGRPRRPARRPAAPPHGDRRWRNPHRAWHVKLGRSPGDGRKPPLPGMYPPRLQVPASECSRPGLCPPWSRWPQRPAMLFGCTPQPLTGRASSRRCRSQREPPFP